MKIGIIGYGIVGSTLAYYLSKNDAYTIDVYDDNILSGTKAAVGIVCPWVTQRRNKAWYELVESGANFYTKLISDLNDKSFIRDTGAYIMHDKLHDKLLNIARTRLESNPLMESVNSIESSDKIPLDFKFNKAIEVTGAFSVDGLKFLESIKRKTENVNFIEAHATLTSRTSINNIEYDKIFICAGARHQDILKDIDIKIDAYAQKGMLLRFDHPQNNYGILMPQGEIDFLYNEDELIIGASHENDYEHTDFDVNIANNLISQAERYMKLPHHNYTYRIGLRSHNSKNLPYFGNLDSNPNMYIVGGLGSSGLSSGPIIGYLLSDHIINNTELDKRYDVTNFIIE